MINFVFIFTCLLSFCSPCQASLDVDIVIFNDKMALGEACAEKIIQCIEKNQSNGKPTVLGLATGSTPIPLYGAFIRLVKERHIDLSKVVTFNLDEYVGLPPSNDQSYHFFMFAHLFNELLYPHYPLGFNIENIFILNGMAKSDIDLSMDETIALNTEFPNRAARQDLSKEEELWVLEKRTKTYEMLIERLGPIDIQILGIGLNGHIGFAEPGSSFYGQTTLAKLSENTRQANARFFEAGLSEVPEYALTMGIGTILKAREIFLLANGKSKAEICQKALQEPISEKIPATALRLHSQVTVHLDYEAAEKLNP